ncbi:MAG: hypothetical protein KF722_12300 [Nitrospira sp.]|nr:hypothetical protein [Nitrospira sp.]
MIIHLNGWPGAGKKTIGQILAVKLNACFIHNHMLHGVAIMCAGVDSPDRWPLYETVRAAAYAALAKRPAAQAFVMTNALCKNAPRERDAWQHVVNLAINRQVPLVPVILQLSPEENYRRVQSADRVGKKMTSAEELKGYFKVDAIQEPDVPETFAVDVTDLSADQAAEQIFSHISTISSTLRPATNQHLQLR